MAATQQDRDPEFDRVHHGRPNNFRHSHSRFVIQPAVTCKQIRQEPDALWLIDSRISRPSSHMSCSVKRRVRASAIEAWG
jgi:hypothetical protein